MTTVFVPIFCQCQKITRDQSFFSRKRLRRPIVVPDHVIGCQCCVCRIYFCVEPASRPIIRTRQVLTVAKMNAFSSDPVCLRACVCVSTKGVESGNTLTSPKGRRCPEHGMKIKSTPARCRCAFITGLALRRNFLNVQSAWSGKERGMFSACNCLLKAPCRRRLAHWWTVLSPEASNRCVPPRPITRP